MVSLSFFFFNHRGFVQVNALAVVALSTIKILRVPALFHLAKGCLYLLVCVWVSVD